MKKNTDSLFGERHWCFHFQKNMWYMLICGTWNKLSKPCLNTICDTKSENLLSLVTDLNNWCFLAIVAALEFWSISLVHMPGDPILHSIPFIHPMQPHLTVFQTPCFPNTFVPPKRRALPPYPQTKNAILFVHPIVRHCDIPHLELASQSPVHAVSLSCQDWPHLFTVATNRAKYSSTPPTSIFHYPPLQWITEVFQEIDFTGSFVYHQDFKLTKVSCDGCNCTWHSCALVFVFVCSCVKLRSID